MKLILTFFVSIVFTVSVGLLLITPQKHTPNTLISPVVISTQSSILFSESGKDHDSWQIYVNNLSKYKIHHPPEVIVKNKKNGEISLTVDSSIAINIFPNKLSENKTISSTIESDIDIKRALYKEKYLLKEIVSSIALSHVTAFTFSANEEGHICTYYYIPQNDKEYLIVENHSTRDNTNYYITSEKIIYSLELIP